MTASRRISRILVLTALTVGLSTAATPALEEEQFRPQLEQFLADESLPEIELLDELRADRTDNWPDDGVLKVELNARHNVRISHVAMVDADDGQVVGFEAARPQFPVPMDVISADEAVEVAMAFAQRNLPELFAEGGEVQVSVDGRLPGHLHDRPITERGARIVHFQRSVNGVEVPTLADVGVRVYDSTVCYWRRKHIPLDDELQIPGEVSLEQAKQIASDNVPYEKHSPVFWFDETHRVLILRDSQVNIWDLWAEIKQPTTPESNLEFFAHWEIDANSGEVLISEGVDPGKNRAARHAYHAAGGEHRPAHTARPFPETAFEDHHPRWTRDGTEIYFLSDRARPGYPSWTSRQWGLFAVAPDGSDLRCVIPRIHEMPKLSPSGDRVAWTSDGIRVRNLADDDELLIECPVRHNSYTDVEWLDETTLAAIIRPPIGAGSIVALDSSAEEPEPRTIAQGEEFCSLMMDHDSGVIYAGIYPPKWKIVRLDPDAAGAEFEVVAEGLWEGRGMRLLGHGKMLLYDTRSTDMGGNRYLLDLTTGEAEGHRMSVTDNDRQREGAPDVRGDGLMVFSALQRDFDERVKPSARLIFTANADGTNVQRVTPWEETVVPMAE